MHDPTGQRRDLAYTELRPPLSDLGRHARSRARVAMLTQNSEIIRPLADIARKERPMPPASRFVDALNKQITNEFAASQQYVAIATFYESRTFPQLARFFYAQAVEERNHAMMMTKYLLDTNAPVRVEGVPAPKTEFEDFLGPIKLALEHERSVSEQISAVFSLAREEGDYLSEQFMQWFLKEQVEEEATMSELVDVAERVRDLPMTLEEYIAREHPGGDAADPTAPPAAGGLLQLG
jgi:bacterioferritin B